MVRVKGWKKIYVDKEQTLRGHIPEDQWIFHGKQERGSFSVITIYKMTSGKGKGRYFVEMWSNGRFDKYSPSFKTKSQALKYAINWMKKHPYG